MTVYKVVRATSKKGVYRSGVIDGWFALRYQLGKLTRKRRKTIGLFVFIDRYEAFHYALKSYDLLGKGIVLSGEVSDKLVREPDGILEKDFFDECAADEHVSPIKARRIRKLYLNYTAGFFVGPYKRPCFPETYLVPSFRPTRVEEE